MMNHLQVIPRHVVPPGNVQISYRDKLVELVTHEARAPGISNRDAHGIVVLWAGRCPCKVHPVIGVDVFLVPDAADLHVCVLVDEGFFFAEVPVLN